MAIVVFSSSGELRRSLITETDVEEHDVIPDPEEAQRIEFDEENNPVLVQALGGNSGRVRFSAGAIQIDGTPYAVQPDSRQATAKKRARQIFATVDDDAAWDALTNVQKAEALRSMIQFTVRALARGGLLPKGFGGS